MKLKSRAADFRVRELLEFRPEPGGEHYVHLLQKEKLSTQEALSRLCMVGEIDRSSVAYAGLKDRQGITEQHISIAGRAFEWREPGLRLTPLREPQAWLMKTRKRSCSAWSSASMMRSRRGRCSR
jgi:tRNA pseudouridine13 synthase